MSPFEVVEWPSDLTGSVAMIRELLELAGVYAEESVERYLADRRQARLGRDMRGTTFITVSFTDPGLLDLFKRADAISLSGKGEWVVRPTWICPNSELGLSMTMSNAAAMLIDGAIDGRAFVNVYFQKADL